MEIDLRNINKKHKLTWSTECSVMSEIIFANLKIINKEMSTKYNYIIVPMSIYNILHESTLFISNYIDSEGIKKVGMLGEFEVYLDMYCESSTILLSWDKQTHRDIKLEKLLNGLEIKEKSIKIIQ